MTLNDLAVVGIAAGGTVLALVILLFLAELLHGYKIDEAVAQLGTDDEPRSDFERHVAEALDQLATRDGLDDLTRRRIRNRVMEAVRDRAVERAVLAECEAIASASGLTPVDGQR